MKRGGEGKESGREGRTEKEASNIHLGRGCGRKNQEAAIRHKKKLTAGQEGARRSRRRGRGG